MIRNNQAPRILRSAAFSAGLLLTTATAATAQTPANRTQELANFDASPDQILGHVIYLNALIDQRGQVVGDAWRLG